MPPLFPLPDYLGDIYVVPTGWEDYSPEIGYRKRPCLVRLKSGEEHGPCWPNAGKFVSLGKGGEWPAAEVVAVAYYRPAEDEAPGAPLKP